MKIYILPIPISLQPKSQPFRYPSHNHDYGVEQDFLRYLLKHPELTTPDPQKSDWHYLPVYWTRWHLNHDFAKTGLVELRQLVDGFILDDAKTFTICQYDGGSQINLGKSLSFLAAPTHKQDNYIPILCSPHRKPLFKLSKKYLACFNGSLETHPIRKQMMSTFENRNDILISGHVGTSFLTRTFVGKQFLTNILESYMALCPRGTSANSFRFFEAMQLGTVPCLLGDIDVRPFANFVNWDEVSFFVKTTSELESIFNSSDRETLLQMGDKAYKLWQDGLRYQKWCKYVVLELEKN